jgi:hypothetical protein
MPRQSSSPPEIRSGQVPASALEWMPPGRFAPPKPNCRGQWCFVHYFDEISPLRDFGGVAVLFTAVEGMAASV